MPRNDRTTSAAVLVLVLGLLAVGLASCSGTADDNADPDDAPVPRPLVTATVYVATTVRVNYHTDLIVFMSPTSSGDQLREVTTAIQGMDVRSALLITADRAYDEARCLLAGRTNVLETLPKELVGAQFRLDFGGDADQALAARLQLQNLSGVVQVTGGEDATTGPGAGATGAATSTPSTTVPLPADAPPPPSCQAEGIRIK